MNTIKFYAHFAAAYGSCWLVLFMVAFITQSRIDLGELGFFGFPAISVVYAYYRFNGNPQLESAIVRTGIWIDHQIDKIHRRYGKK